MREDKKTSGGYNVKQHKEGVPQDQENGSDFLPSYNRPYSEYGLQMLSPVISASNNSRIKILRKMKNYLKPNMKGLRINKVSLAVGIIPVE